MTPTTAELIDGIDPIYGDDETGDQAPSDARLAEVREGLKRAQEDWTSREDEIVRGRAAVSKAEKRTSKAWSLGHVSPGTRHVYVYSGVMPVAAVIGSNASDNAPMISAAPDLLEALQNALAAGLPTPVADAARAAILKATGA